MYKTIKRRLIKNGNSNIPDNNFSCSHCHYNFAVVIEYLGREKLVSNITGFLFTWHIDNCLCYDIINI